MRVLHVIDSLGVGGAERFLLTILPELKRQGTEVGVAVCGGSMALADDFLSQEIPVYVFPRHAKWNVWRAAQFIHETASEFEAQVVHAHLYFPILYTAFSRYFFPGRYKTFCTFHNLAYAAANKPGVKLAVKKCLAKSACALGIDRKVAVSQAVAEHFKRELGIADITVINNPIDISTTDRHLNWRLELKRDDADRKPLWVVPGRLVKEKGHSVFLEAFAGLSRPASGVQVLFAGYGPLQVALENDIRRLKLHDTISISGQLTHDEILQYMAKASLVVVPSVQEGFGLTALEAMALQCPLIVSDAGGLPEVVGETALIVPRGDSVALMEALAKNLACKTDFDSRAIAAYQRARDLFALPAIAEKTGAMYAALLNSRTTP